jgi:hypothetical protein
MQLSYFSYAAFYFKLFLFSIPISTDGQRFLSICSHIFVETFRQKLVLNVDRDLERFAADLFIPQISFDDLNSI